MNAPHFTSFWWYIWFKDTIMNDLLRGQKTVCVFSLNKRQNPATNTPTWLHYSLPTFPPLSVSLCLPCECSGGMAACQTRAVPMDVGGDQGGREGGGAVMTFLHPIDSWTGNQLTGCYVNAFLCFHPKTIDGERLCSPLIQLSSHSVTSDLCSECLRRSCLLQLGLHYSPVSCSLLTADSISLWLEEIVVFWNLKYVWYVRSRRIKGLHVIITKNFLRLWGPTADSLHLWHENNLLIQFFKTFWCLLDVMTQIMIKQRVIPSLYWL